ncbi:MAG: penicillin-binding protein 2 [Elusimicrobiota bacterium]
MDGQLFTPALDRRLKSLSALASVGFMVLVLRLFSLQVLEGPALEEKARLNKTQIIPVQAPRGYILDRHGDILIYNVPSFSLFYSAKSVSKEDEKAVEDHLVGLFPKSKDVVRRKVLEARRTGKRIRVLSAVPHEAALGLIERKMSLPGIHVLAEPKRKARYGALAAHVLGYVDEVSPQELKRLGDSYKAGQLIGKAGVERNQDAVLRGVDGGLQFEMDHKGRYVEEVGRIASESGRDLMLNLDRSLQQALEEGLDAVASGRGAAVVLDPRSGALLAMASRPAYDPSGDVVPLLVDPRLPLFNRAVQGGYAPGSVFKLVTAGAALEEGEWSVKRAIHCPGFFTLGRKAFGCWKKEGHGTLAFQGAMAGSCNVYFFNMGLRAGPDAMERLARSFGLGRRTGVDLPSESPGLVPGREWKRRARGAGWYDGDTLNFAIGQGAVSATPLQIGVLMAAAVNGGVLWQPSAEYKVIDSQGRSREKKPEIRGRIRLSPETWRVVHESLEGVVKNGTGRSVWRPDLTIGGKTGTAQNPHGDDHAWFACYAGRPGEEASLVVAVMAENGGHGATAAAPVARRVIDRHFPPPPRPAPVRAAAPAEPAAAPVPSPAAPVGATP